jgi:hypothetical protein
MANRNRFRNDWFSDGSYFSENGETIHTVDGTPLCYFDEIPTPSTVTRTVPSSSTTTYLVSNLSGT